MSVLDDARRLAAHSPDGSDDRGDTMCIYCYADRYVKRGGAYTRLDAVQHEPDCLWPALPAIVAALEAAERVVAANAEDARHYETRCLTRATVDDLAVAMAPGSSAAGAGKSVS